MLFSAPGDLLDERTVRSYDVVPGASLNLDVWNMWSSLVEAAASGDFDQVPFFMISWKRVDSAAFAEFGNEKKPNTIAMGFRC